MNLPRAVTELLAAHRGLPPHETRARERSGNVPVDSLMEVFLEKYRILKPTPEQTLMHSWKEVMGADAARCAPREITPNGTLLIVVANPVLRREMLFQRSLYLARIRRLPDCDHIRDLRFIAG